MWLSVVAHVAVASDAAVVLMKRGFLNFLIVVNNDVVLVYAMIIVSGHHLL